MLAKLGPQAYQLCQPISTCMVMGKVQIRRLLLECQWMQISGAEKKNTHTQKKVLHKIPLCSQSVFSFLLLWIILSPSRSIQWDDEPLSLTGTCTSLSCSQDARCPYPLQHRISPAPRVHLWSAGVALVLLKYFWMAAPEGFWVILKFWSCVGFTTVDNTSFRASWKKLWTSQCSSWSPHMSLHPSEPKTCTLCPLACQQ